MYLIQQLNYLIVKICWKKSYRVSSFLLYLFIQIIILIDIFIIDELNVLKPVNNIETSTNMQPLLSNQFSRT